MLKETDVADFLSALPLEAQVFIKTLQNKESWPLDDTETINAAIIELSELLTKKSSNLGKAENSESLSVMALLKMPRALILLTKILEHKENFIQDVLDDPGITGRDVEHKVIMINRLTVLARTQLISKVFSKEKCSLILSQLKVQR